MVNYPNLGLMSFVLMICTISSGLRERSRFGRELRTPAMQAGLTRRRLTFREVFETDSAFLASNNVIFAFSAAPFVSVAVR
jgi:hypothetical protein